MVSGQDLAVKDTIVCSGPTFCYRTSYLHWFRQRNSSLFKGMRIRPRSEHCHRHFTDFMLFFAPTKKLYVSWQLVRMSIELNESSRRLSREFEILSPPYYAEMGRDVVPDGFGSKRKIKRNGWTKCNLKKIRTLFHILKSDILKTTEIYFN